MARKICAAGVVGSYSYMVFDNNGSAVSSIKDDDIEIVTNHVDIVKAEMWTERKLRELIGKRYYEADGI